MAAGKKIKVGSAAPKKKAGLERILKKFPPPKKPPPTKPAKSLAAKQVRQPVVKNFLDPMANMPAPLLVADGKALAHTGLVSEDFIVGDTNTTILLVTNTGGSGSVGVLFDVDPAGTVIAASRKVLTIPTMAASDTEGGPSASRPMKFGVSVVNCSNALKRGGRVTYLNSSQRLPGRADPPNQYGPLLTGIKSCPYRRRICGDTLSTPTQLVGFPIDHARYNTFVPHAGTLDFQEFLSHVLGASAIDSPADRPMSIVAYIFDPVADRQDYSVTIRAAMYTRWPLTSVPGQSMKHMPTSTAAHINAVHTHNEETANDLVHIAEGGVIANVAPKLFGAARGGLAAAQGYLNRGAMAAAEELVEVLGPEAAFVAAGAL
jgi:hypothetical protein